MDKHSSLSTHTSHIIFPTVSTVLPALPFAPSKKVKSLLDIRAAVIG